MCQALCDLREAVSRYSSGFDPSVLSVAEARTVVSEAAAIEAMAATIKSLASTRATEGMAWRDSGCRSAAEALARQTGTSVGQARDALDTGCRLQQHPDVAEAARAGRLSPAQASVICEGAEADPTAASRLVETAQRASFAELRDEVALTKAAAVVDPEARRREIHSRRKLRAWTDLEGVWQLRASGNVEDGAQIMAALSPIANELSLDAGRRSRREAPEAYAFDALVELAVESVSVENGRTACEVTSDGPAGGIEPSGPAEPTLEAVESVDSGSERSADELASMQTGPKPDIGRAAGSPAGDRGHSARRGKRRRRGAPVKLLVRIDYDAWLRGVALPGETCELAGYGPVPVSVVHDLVARGDPFVAAILTRGKELVGAAHLGRAPTAYQQSALEWLYPTCAVEGCPARIRLQRDHRTDWAKTHYTVLDELDMLCAYHHALKTRENWALVRGSGSRAFVPPADPRHPAYKARRVRRTPTSVAADVDVLKAEFAVGDQTSGLVCQVDPP